MERIPTKLIVEMKNEQPTKEPSSERPDFEAKIEFYREQTAKLREYLEVNRIGRANQNLFEALYDHVKEQREKIQSLKQEIERLRSDISESQWESFERLKNSTVCITCSVPLDVHGTCCGWINAQIKINESGIIIDPRHPGYCLDINTWRNRQYDKHNNKHA